jgi:hypothetical protein
MDGFGTKRGHLVAQMRRPQFWSRVCSRGEIGAGGLIRVHQHALRKGIPTDEAVVALGMLTEDQVVEIHAGGEQLRASASGGIRKAGPRSSRLLERAPGMNIIGLEAEGWCPRRLTQAVPAGVQGVLPRASASRLAARTRSSAT